jgi:hypothetical protein
LTAPAFVLAYQREKSNHQAGRLLNAKGRCRRLGNEAGMLLKRKAGVRCEGLGAGGQRLGREARGLFLNIAVNAMEELQALRILLKM